MANTRAKQTVIERVARELREQILAGEYEPGTPLREQELGSAYGISRHAVREVLRTLAAEGLAEYASFRGARVPKLSVADVKDIYRARELLECGALKQEGHKVDARNLSDIHGRFAEAIQARDWRKAYELDARFHGAFVALANSRRASVCHSELMQELRLGHLYGAKHGGSGHSESIAQHAEIIVALAAEDIDRAVAALRKHLSYSESLLSDEIGTNNRNTSASA